MKQITIRIVVTLSTFIIGIIIVANWLVIPEPHFPDIPPIDVKADTFAPFISKVSPDSTVHSVKFCDLIRNSAKYDGKIVRTQAFYDSDTDTAALTDSRCQEWIRPVCNRKEAPCREIWNRITFDNQRVEIIGRYTADIADPDPLQNGYHVRLFEILELKDTKSSKARRK
jgi:hypothetical protein